MARTLRRDYSAVHHTGQSNTIVRLQHYSDYTREQNMAGKTHDINELLHLSFAFGPNLPHLQRYERTQGISLRPHAYNDEHVAVSKARVTELRAATLVASASRICLNISPRFGAGTLLITLYASLDLSRARSTSAGVAWMPYGCVQYRSQ